MYGRLGFKIPGKMSFQFLKKIRIMSNAVYLLSELIVIGDHLL